MSGKLVGLERLGNQTVDIGYETPSNPPRLKLESNGIVNPR
jgi:hypothetical protein